MTEAKAEHAKWELVVGLEVHVQLNTRTKIFCGCSTHFGDAPNLNTCPVCLALPGALPVLNAHAVELATRASIALNCSVQATSVFARKNYFYPDLPKGYQISQFDKPLATSGFLDVGHRADGSPVRVGITRVHMEEDAGKSIHDRFQGRSAVDLNRSGTPLIEIVSEPDIRSAEHAAAYLRMLKQIMEYAEISDVNMEEGSLRVDANVSVRRRGETKLGTKAEVKNLNSFSGVSRAIEAEFTRQVKILEGGNAVKQETLSWDGSTLRPSRAKEGSDDYRYFPEPDLPPLILATDWIDAQGKLLPELPVARSARLQQQYALTEYAADVLTSSRHVADYFEDVVLAHEDARAAASMVMGDVMAHLKVAPVDIRELRARPADVAQLLAMVRDGVASQSAAKQIFQHMTQSGEPPAQIAQRENLLQVGDNSQLHAWIDEVLAEMPDEAARLRAGERRLVGVLVGAAMRKSGGRADPKKLNQLLSNLSS